MLIFSKDDSGQLILVETDCLGYDEDCRELYANTSVGTYAWQMPDFLAEQHLAAAFALGKLDLSHNAVPRLVED